MLQTVKGRVAVASTLMTITMLGLMAGPASATTDPVDTAFNDMESKVTNYGGAIIALVVLAAGIFLGIKYLRKGLSKA